MRLLYYYRDNQDVMDQWQKYHFFDELSRSHHEIDVFNPYMYNSIEIANEELVNYAKIGKWDLFMTAHGSNLLYPETIKQISSLGVPSLLICFDNLHAPFMHKAIAPYFDLVWLTSYETKPMFEKWGCKCIFLPYAANPYTYFPVYKEEINTVGFIGTPYGSRIEKINDLVNAGINCTVYSGKVNASGNVGKHKKSLSDYYNILHTDFDLMRFPIGRKVLAAKYYKKFLVKNSMLSIESENLNVRPSVTFEKMNELYSNFALSLGITELWDTYVLSKPIYKLHLRTFEIPMCGGLQFTAYVDELANYFESDKEIIFYSSKEEYIDKAKFYLRDNNSTLRRKMKESARFRAEVEHTWTKRFEKVFNLLGKK